ncbi:MAG: hypothetical protein AAFQ89_20575, partial [Cyanobacteria bacterium J06626_18]
QPTQTYSLPPQTRRFYSLLRTCQVVSIMRFSVSRNLCLTAVTLGLVTIADSSIARASVSITSPTPLTFEDNFQHLAQFPPFPSSPARDEDDFDDRREEIEDHRADFEDERDDCLDEDDDDDRRACLEDLRDDQQDEVEDRREDRFEDIFSDNDDFEDRRDDFENRRDDMFDDRDGSEDRRDDFSDRLRDRFR